MVNESSSTHRPAREFSTERAVRTAASADDLTNPVIQALTERIEKQHANNKAIYDANCKLAEENRKLRDALLDIADGQTGATTHEQSAVNYRRIAREALNG